MENTKETQVEEGKDLENTEENSEKIRKIQMKSKWNNEKIWEICHPSQICFNLVQRFQRRRFKCDLLSIYA